MKSLPAPNGGRFVLRQLRQAGACPSCGERVKKMWHYVEADRKKLTRANAPKAVGCESCAGSAK